MKIIWFF